MSGPVDRLARNYPPAFLAFLTHRNEKNLARAYELGRDALSDGISLLDLIRTHHAVFGQVLSTASTAADVAHTVDAAAAFLVEALAPYEMARRGFMENAAPPGQSGTAGPQ
ncbi:phosphatase RsbU N-terminal domain-containing protein [Nakamurella sp. GG22]